MQPDPQLEAQIQRLLHDLPDVPAPATLAPRVLATIRARSARPWWQQSWAAWPRQIQAIALVSLGLVALALSLAAGWVWQDATLPSLSGAWRESVPALGGTLVQATLSLLRHAGTAWLLAGLTAVVMMYLTCVGVGTLYFRLVLARR